MPFALPTSHNLEARGTGGDYDEATGRLLCVNCGYLSRLIDWLMSGRHLHASPLVGKMPRAIRRFGPGEFDDDLTFLATGSRPLLQRESGKRVGA